MRLLLIDSSEPGFAKAWTCDHGQLLALGDVGHVRGLLRRIAPVIKTVEGVAVCEGPGTFSAIRQGVLIANVLARFRRIPLFSVTKAEVQTEEDWRRIADEIARGRKAPAPYVAPVYDREPTITTPVSH